MPLATDGQDGNKLQLEKNRACFFVKFSFMSNKNHYKLIMFCSLLKNTLASPSSSSKTIFVLGVLLVLNKRDIFDPKTQAGTNGSEASGTNQGKMERHCSMETKFPAEPKRSI